MLRTWLLFLATLPIWGSDRVTTITGRITGEDGKPAIRAAALLYQGASGTAIEVAEADSKGRFSLKTALRGLLVLKLSAVGHLPSTALLPLEGSRRISVDARLSRPAFRNIDWAGKPVYVEGANAQGKLERQPDGTFSVVVATSSEAPMVRFFSSSPDSRNFTLTDAAEYRIDSKEFQLISVHAAVVKPMDGKVRLTLDPAKLRPSLRGPEIAVKGLDRRYDSLQAAWRQMEQREYLPRDKQSTEAPPIPAGPFSCELEKELLWFDRARRLPYTKNLTAANAQAILNAVRPESEIWGLLPYVLGDTLRAAAAGQTGSKDAFVSYFSKSVDALPKGRRLGLLSSRYYDLVEEDRFEEARLILARMEKEEPGSDFTKEVMRKIGGLDLLTIPGKKIPHWQAQAMGDPSTVYTHETITAKARIYLLDFWASW